MSNATYEATAFLRRGNRNTSNRISSFVPCWPTQIFTTGSCNQPPPDGGWFSVLTYPSWGALPFNPFENLPEDFSPLRHGNPASKIHKFVIQRYSSCAHLWVATSEVDSGMRRSMCTYHSTFTPCSLDAFGLMPRCGTGWLAGWQLMLALRTHQRVAGALQTTVSWCRLMWDATWRQDVTPKSPWVLRCCSAVSYWFSLGRPLIHQVISMPSTPGANTPKPPLSSVLKLSVLTNKKPHFDSHHRHRWRWQLQSHPFPHMFLAKV